MTDFNEAIKGTRELTKAEQKNAGKPIAGNIDGEHKNFLKTLRSLLDKKEIDPYDPQSFLKMDVYNALPEEWKDKADLSLFNIADQVRMIYEFLESKETPDESPQLETMVKLLWQSKQQIESHYDIFKF